MFLNLDAKFFIGWTIWLIVVAVGTVAGGCVSRFGGKVERALVLAGANRLQLEQALEHFSRNPADSLRLRACEFLIANMPGHAGYEGEGLERFRRSLDSIHPGEPFLCQALQSVYYRTLVFRPTLSLEEDLQTVDASFLIRHVERCFAKWKRLPWLKNLTFEEFCDYVLPYRLEYERLEDAELLLDSVWMEGKCRLAADAYDDIHDFPNAVAEACAKRVWNVEAFLPEPFKMTYTLECYENALLQLYRYRAIGIPCALDMVPVWGNVNGSHYWASVRDPFFHESLPVDLSFRKVPKVYRMLYRHNDWHVEDDGLPDWLSDPCWHDVTDRYIPTVDVKVAVSDSSDSRPYLCVFNGGKWVEVAVGKIRAGYALFEKMGCGIIYLPVYRDRGVRKVAGEPFVLECDGTVKVLGWDGETISFTAYRKYPYNHAGRGGGSMVGVRFECAACSDYTDSEVVYEVRENTLMNSRVVDCGGKEARYWRMRPYVAACLAELEFMSGDTVVRDFKVSEPEDASVCFDGNPLTYGIFPGVLDVDFGRTVRIDSIRYLPMNDGNGIFPGHLYELKCWKDGGWKTVERLKAEDFRLDFNSVPSGGLYWLSDLTAGKEERIFIVEEGRIKFY